MGSWTVRCGGGCGLRRAVLGQCCRVVVLGLLVETVQLFDKAADVPVVVPTVRLRGLLPGRALQRFVGHIIDKDGLTVLKTVEVPQLQFIIVGLGMHLNEIVQKTVEVPQLPSRLVVQFMDKVVDMPVVQCVDKVVDVAVVRRYAHCRKPVKLPQVQSLDKVLQFIDKVACISVVAQS